MTEREPKSLQDLNLVDRFLFDQVMEAPGAYQTMVNILLEELKQMEQIPNPAEFKTYYDL